MLVEGPFGHLTGDVRKGRKLLMLGAGAGVSPLLSILESEPYAPGEAILVTRDHTDEDALRTDAVADLVRRRGLRHFRLIGPRLPEGSTWLPAAHADWRGADLIRHLAPDLEDYDVFVCGPLPWMSAVRADLDAAGIRADRVHTEAFTI